MAVERLTRREMAEALLRRGVHVPRDWNAARVRSAYDEIVTEGDEVVLSYESPGWKPGSPRG